MARSFRFSALSLFLACTSCVQTPDIIEITVTHLGDSDAWKVDYRLPEPVREMFFVRKETLYRTSFGDVADGNVEISSYNDYEIVRGLDGERFDRFSVIAPSFSELLQRDYSQNYRFTDGSSLLFTGHFIVSDSVSRPIDYRLQLVSSDDEHIVVRGNSFETDVVIDDPGEEGLFAYFGTLTPIQDRNYIAVLDSGLPDWLADSLPEYLPQLFEFYTYRLGDALETRPSIFFSYEEGNAETSRFGGSALLDGTYQLRASGRAWHDPNPDLRSVVPSSIAHESVHLWNGHAIAVDNSLGGSWMHEGGAEILAWQAMHELGYLSSDDFDSKLSEAYEHCASRLAGRALGTITDVRAQRLHYSCGAVIGRVSGISLQQNGSDLFAFWRRLIQRAIANPTFSERDYVDLLREMSANDKLVAALEGLVFEAQEDTKAQLDNMFDVIGTVSP